MKSSYTIQDELRELNSTLPFEKTQPYSVPDGYFDNLATAVLTKIKTQEASEELSELSPLLASIPRRTPFTVPDNYFQQNTRKLSGIVAEDTVPDILATTDKKMPYQVPEGYFDTLPQQILAKVNRPKAKVISLTRSRFMRYAAAAIITGAIALGSITYFNKKNTVDLTRQPHEWIAKKLKNVSNQDLEEFIETTEPLTSQHTLAKNGTSGKEVRKLLQDIPTSELDAFLKSVPHDYDEQTVIN